MGGVFSLAEGFNSLDVLWGAFAFHTVAMLLGMFCLERARRPKPAEQLDAARG
jgi:hypothetical protein